MPHLSPDEIEAFHRDGFIVVPDAVSPGDLAALRAEFDGWVEESRNHRAAYGTTVDGRARFDLEGDHSAEKPALRRVASPTEISETYRRVAFESRLADLAADLIGPDMRFHHAKVNSKLPHSSTVVKWHQDFTFDPHSNDDTLTALLFVDAVTAENGPLRVAPGTHRGPLHSLWQDGVFTGAVDDVVVPEFEAAAVSCTGPAGAVCLMHSRVAHASSSNRSDAPRTLYIVTYAAADAVPLAPIAVPSVHQGAMVRGREPGRIRSVPFEMEAPQIPEGASFFVQQSAARSTGAA